MVFIFQGPKFSYQECLLFKTLFSFPCLSKVDAHKAKAVVSLLVDEHLYQ